MKSKILILGSSSFSGSSMVNFLLNKNKFKVYGTYRRIKKKNLLPFNNCKNIKLFKNYKIDLLKDSKKLIKIIGEIKPDYIVDFASICMVNESWKNSDYYFKINVRSRVKLVEYLNKTKSLKKYIYISTPEIFGSSKKFRDENCKDFNPSTPYAASKLSAELLLKNYCQYFKFPLIIARFSNFYGPGQPLYRLIPKIITCIDNKSKFPLQGSGKSKRNFIFTYDFCFGIYKILQKGLVGETYHFSGNNFQSVIKIIKTACDLKSYHPNKLIKKSKGRIGQDLLYKLGSKKTRRLLKWKPVYTLKKGLKEVIIYHNKYFKKVKKDNLVYKDPNLKK